LSGIAFSVVTAAFNARATIRDAVESALGQTHRPLEVIVSDDGSTDDIAEVLEPYGADVMLLRNKHRGPGAARNAALRAASGDFIGILDADDVYEPKRLQALGDLILRRPDLDIVTTDALLERDGSVVGHFYRDDFTFPVEHQRREILRRCFLFAPAVRRERMEQIGGFDEAAEIAPAEDWDCWMRLILDGARAGLVAEPLVRYRLHPGSLTANRARSLRARVTVMEKASRRSDLTVDERRHLTRSLEVRRRDAVVSEASTAIQNGDPDARRRCLAVLFSKKVSARQRVKAAGGLMSPRLIRRRAAR
jgi:glycosyltransferase involved in cell wall biosynthesis